jgi:hypothetical protein
VNHRGPPPEEISGEFSGEPYSRNRGHDREALPLLFPNPRSILGKELLILSILDLPL